MSAPLPVIVTYRPLREGGRFDGDESRRLEVLHQAAKLAPTFIDVERDVPAQSWPDAPIIISHHDLDRTADAGTLASAMEASPAAIKKIVFSAAGPEDALAALDLLHAGGRKPAIALAI